MNTVFFSNSQGKASLIILVENTVKSIQLSEQTDWSIGRATITNFPDIEINTEIVSRKHARICNVNNQWFYIDNGSVNGTYYNGEKIVDGAHSPIKLYNGDILRIDSDDLKFPNPNGVWMMFTTDDVGKEWESYKLDSRNVVIGRNSQKCDIVIDLPYISEKHCKIVYTKHKYYVYDCQSVEGTWVNNQKIDAPVLLKEKDKISLCDRHFIYTGKELIYNKVIHYRKTDENSPVMIKADIASKIVKNSNGMGKKELIKDIHLEIKQGSLVALLGGSGAGKTTVMNCLNGMDMEGVHGKILFNGEDLQKNFSRLKYRIGSVPQENVLHDMLTVESELKDAAELRLPKGVSKKEIENRVDIIIRQLRLDKQRNMIISKCSGGEKSRVNIGIDLVADKSVLCLDEPDKGLDPKSKNELFTILRDLAHNEGKSILVIIHDVADIDMFDQIIMMTKLDNVGRLAFSGSPSQAREYFGTDVKNRYKLVTEYPSK